MKLEKKSSIIIQLVLQDNVLNFKAENTNFKTSSQQNELDSGIGLENVKRRLDLIYPNKHDLKITESKEKFVVKLKIELD